jgi:hypothetical protein
MAEQDQKQKQPKQQKHNMLDAKKDEPTIKFERRVCHGWHAVVFPTVHDQNTVLELWLYDVFEWMKMRGFTDYFWCYAHGIEKKDQNRLSPAFFFKDEMHACNMMWRFKGEIV